MHGTDGARQTVMGCQGQALALGFCERCIRGNHRDGGVFSRCPFEARHEGVLGHGVREAQTAELLTLLVRCCPEMRPFTDGHLSHGIDHNKGGDARAILKTR